MVKRLFDSGICIAALLLAMVCGACSTVAPRNDWEHRLRGDAVVMLGEVHDNAEQHRLRLLVLRHALAAGWRPAIAMEQFDREHQIDIDRARRERPGDAQHVIDLAAPVGTASSSGWNWDFYRPFVALALEYDLPLIATNVSNSDTTNIVRGGYSAVFDNASIARLGLDQPIAPDWQAAQEREIDAGHCHVLPQAALPRMARAQYARDAVMAEELRKHAGNGVILLAGNGHVRRDIGVPRWMNGPLRDRVFAVAYLERNTESIPDSVFDAVVRTAPAERPDPCAEFEKRKRRQ
ncbi:MAG: ChaN family lipoprotein [Burkholderiales bacterium]|nr:ChaN family lipoprotein [Burkholderiales bacterium]